MIDGHSRGALQAIQMANIIQEMLPNCEIELYLRDPVIGPMDHMGVDPAVWKNKFKLPKGKTFIFYSTQEDRTVYGGVITPEQFHTSQEGVALLTVGASLTHSGIQATQQDAKKDDSSVLQKNNIKRDCIQSFILHEMGLIQDLDESDIAEFEKFLFEKELRSEQRAAHNFHFAKNLQHFSPELQKIINKFNQHAENVLNKLRDYLFLDELKISYDPALPFISRLQSDLFLKEIAEILSEKSSSQNKLRKINHACLRFNDQNSPIMKAVKEIIVSPESKENFLFKFKSTVEEYRVEAQKHIMSRLSSATEPGYFRANQKMDSFRNVINARQYIANEKQSVFQKLGKLISRMIDMLKFVVTSKSVQDDILVKPSRSNSEPVAVATTTATQQELTPSRPSINRSLSM